MRRVKTHKHWEILVRKHWVQLVLLIFIANIGIYFSFKWRSKAQTCYTMVQVNAETEKCLYVANGKVYEKGSMNGPYHNNMPCGMDVSSILPQSHSDNYLYYLDPNYRGDICTTSMLSSTLSPSPSVTADKSNFPTSAPSVTSTVTPSITVTVTPSLSPSPSPTVVPSATLVPTVRPVSTPTTIPTTAPIVATSCDTPKAVTNIILTLPSCTGR